MIKKRSYIAYAGKFILQNPGAGAWSCGIYDLESSNTSSVTSGSNYIEHTTPNFLDLEALVITLESFKNTDTVYYVHDSPYLDNILKKWIFQWEANNFKTSNDKPVNNEPLIRRLSGVRKRYNLQAIYVNSRNKPIYCTIADTHARLVLYAKQPRITPKESLSKIIETA